MGRPLVIPKNRSSRAGFRFVGMLKNAVDIDESGGPATSGGRILAGGQGPAQGGLGADLDKFS